MTSKTVTSAHDFKRYFQHSPIVLPLQFGARGREAESRAGCRRGAQGNNGEGIANPLGTEIIGLF